MSRIFNYVHILEFCVQPLTRFLLIRSFHVNGQFQWKDPLSIERLLSDEERSIRDVARKYAKDNLMPRVVQCFRHERFERSLEMGKLGLLGATIRGFGCSGISPIASGLIAHEIEKVDSGFRTSLSIQSSLVMHSINEYGSDAQKNRYLPSLAKGSLLGCFCITEANHGSNPSGMECIALHDQHTGEYILNGTKTWITNSPVADLFIVWGKLVGWVGASAKPQGKSSKSGSPASSICGFLVERSARGLRTPVIEGKLSLRTSIAGHVVLEDVRVPAANILPGANRLSAAFNCMNNARYGIAWGALGAASACYEIAREYVVARQQFGRPLAANQLVQLKLADMATDIGLGLLGCVQVGRMLEAGSASPEHLSHLKRNSAGRALAVARAARDLLGALGIVNETHVLRHAMNLEAVNTYEGTQDVHALVLGRAITGVQAFF